MAACGALDLRNRQRATGHHLATPRVHHRRSNLQTTGRKRQPLQCVDPGPERDRRRHSRRHPGFTSALRRLHEEPLPELGDQIPHGCVDAATGSWLDMRDIAFALIMLGLIPFVAMRPYIGLLVWSWLGYMNPHRLTFGFAYNFPWVMLIAVITLLSLWASQESKRIPKSMVSVLLVLFLLWTGFTTFFAVVPAIPWQRWQEFAKTLVLVLATLTLVNTRERMHWLVWVIAVSLGF